MLAALAGAIFAFGLLVLLKGLFPGKPGLEARLNQFSASSGGRVLPQEEDLFATYALMLLESIKGDSLERYESDVLVTGSDLPTMAVDKAKAAGVGAAVLGALAVVLEMVSDPLGLLITVSVGAILGYFYPDMELKKKAAERRVEFGHTLTAFMTMLSAGMSGGGGLTTALTDAAAMGDGWVFDNIRGALETARLESMSAWQSLEKLGQKLQVVPLTELAAALTLAGDTGARVTDTLVARAQSSREKELSEVRAEAEAKSAKLGVPVGMVMLTWVFFVGYPAVAGITAGL